MTSNHNTITENEGLFLQVVRNTIQHKRTIILVLAITFALSCAIIFPIPRYYNSSVTLAPELEGLENESKLSSIASAMGFDIGSNIYADALSPNIYPELIGSNDFIASLIQIQVPLVEGYGKVSYYEYLSHHQKVSIYTKFIKWILPIKKDTTNPTRVNPFRLTKAQFEVFETIRHKISCDIDIKTGLITISVQDQSPLISAIIADSVRFKLQSFITQYRTGKAKNDLNYYKKLSQKAKIQYEKSRQLYASYSDANSEVTLMSLRSKIEDLENDMQLKYNAYSTLNTQMQNAAAKLQERTPAFTVVQRASVPVKPAGPKRMAFIAAMLLLSLIVSVAYLNKNFLLAKA